MTTQPTNNPAADPRTARFIRTLNALPCDLKIWAVLRLLQIYAAHQWRKFCTCYAVKQMGGRDDKGN